MANCCHGRYLQCSSCMNCIVHVYTSKAEGLTTAYLGDMAIFDRNLSLSMNCDKPGIKRLCTAQSVPESVNQSFKAGSACGQRVTGVQGRVRGREGSIKGHVLMPSAQCYDDLPSKDLCLHTGDRGSLQPNVSLLKTFAL